MSAPTELQPAPKGKRTADDADYEPPLDDEGEGEEDSEESEWSDVDSDNLLGDEDEEDEDAADKGHLKSRRDCWKALVHPWQRLGYFLESGTRFSIIERDGFYVVKKNSKQGSNYLLNKAKLFEENGFHWSDYRSRWQRPVADGVHDLVSWKPEGFQHKTEGQRDMFDDFE